MTYYNRFNPADPATQHESVDLHEDRFAQAAELNEVQSIQHAARKAALDLLFADGDIGEGAALTVDPATGAATAAAGKIYMDGAIRPVPAANLLVPTVGTAMVGIYLVRRTITHNDDPGLRGMDDALPFYNEPGADRTHVDLTWGLPDDGQPGAWYRVWEVEDGIVKPRATAPQLSAVTQAIERYDVDSAGGTYRISGLDVTQIDDAADGKQQYMIAAGRAHIIGRLIEQPTQRRVLIDPQQNLATVDAEPHPSTSEVLQRITVNRPPIVGIPQVTIQARRTVTLTRGVIPGGADNLAPGAMVLESVKQGATNYGVGVNCKLTAGEVDWSLAGAEPAPGSTYQVTFTEQTGATPQNLTDTGFDVVGALNNSVVTTRYQHALRRIDRLCLDATGTPQLVRGMPDVWEPVAPPVPDGLLLLSTIRQRWTQRRVLDDGVAMVPMPKIQALSTRINDLEWQLANVLLAVDVAGRYGGQAHGKYADPMQDDSMRDLGRMQTAVIGDGVLQLPAGIDGINIDPGNARHTIAHTPQPWLSQLLQTGTIKPNGSGIVLAAPTTATLSPSVDRWVHQEDLGALLDVSGQRVWANKIEDVEAVAKQAIIDSQGTRKTYMREQPVRVDITSFKPGETVATVEFGGAAAAITANTAANASGNAACTFNIPPGVLAGTVAVLITGSQGSQALAQFVGSPSFEYQVRVMFGPRGFGGFGTRTITL